MQNLASRNFEPSPVSGPARLIDLGDLRAGDLQVCIASSERDVEEAQALRYRVFVEEMGAHPTAEIKRLKRDFDDFDAYCDHLLVVQHIPNQKHPKVVGTYRMLRKPAMRALGRFYTDSEFNIHKIHAMQDEVLEVGRSCVDPEFRNRAVMQLLWRGIGAYVSKFNIALLFGCASLPGIEIERHRQALSYLHHFHLAPEAIRPQALPHRYVEMNLMEENAIAVRETFNNLPTLIKGYIRLGGFVSKGAVIDKEYNTIDVCVVVQTEHLSEKYVQRFGAAKNPLTNTLDQ